MPTKISPGIIFFSDELQNSLKIISIILKKTSHPVGEGNRLK